MKIRLGVITTEPHLDYLRVMEEELKDKCSIKIFVVYDISEVDDIYRKNINAVDGFVLSGVFIHEAIHPDHLNKELPMRILNDNETEMYKQLFRLLISKPNIDISRIYIDFAYLMDSFDEFKAFFTKHGKPVDGYDLKKRIQLMLENHLTLWDEGKIDLSITAMGAFVPELEKRGIHYIFIKPTLEYVREIFKDILNEITIIKLNNKKAVVGNIHMEKNEDGKISQHEPLTILKEKVSHFLHIHHLVDTAQIMNDYVQVDITYEDFISITSNIQNCSLLHFLDKELKGMVKIGWGLGREYYQARENAIKANKQAKAFKGSCSFYISEEQKVIGPLQNKEMIQYKEQGDSEIIQLAQHMDINNINLQKIISYAEMIGTNKLSSEDVARCLSITVRGANRILNKIEEKGYAKIIFEKRENTKGRPKKYYELVFIDENGNRI